MPYSTQSGQIRTNPAQLDKIRYVSSIVGVSCTRFNNLPYEYMPTHALHDTHAYICLLNRDKSGQIRSIRTKSGTFRADLAVFGAFSILFTFHMAFRIIRAS
jgi:hypothetical protein